MWCELNFDRLKLKINLYHEFGIARFLNTGLKSKLYMKMIKSDTQPHKDNMGTTKLSFCYKQLVL